MTLRFDVQDVSPVIRVPAAIPIYHQNSLQFGMEKTADIRMKQIKDSASPGKNEKKEIISVHLNFNSLRDKVGIEWMKVRRLMITDMRYREHRRFKP